MSIWVVFKLIGSLALLMFGMKSMSESLQKMAGPQLRRVLGAMTTNRFTGVLTGMFVTAAVQSSTATTLMTVSFVNAGLLTLIQAISVIMGAHIGTTVSAWIMSLGFSFNITDFVYPAFALGIVLIYMKKRRVIGDFLFGVAFLFLGLGTLKETGFAFVHDPAMSDSITAFFANFNNPSFWNSLLFLFMGTVLTLCVQSSAAIMAITMILCSTGVLHIDQGIMLVLGENIGTTITANIVALGANVQARRAAFAHLTTNVIGVTWALIFLKPFVNTVCGFVGFDQAIQPGDPGYDANLLKISVVLAAFHSAFNITNTFLLIWFVPQIEKFVCKVIKPQREDEEDDFKLHFITSGIMKTPELSVFEAQKEIQSFGERIRSMFGMVRELLDEEDKDKFVKLYSRIEKYEEISDQMEIDIANYLHDVSDAHLSDDTKAKMRAMLREISEIESIGDSCYKIARIINRYVTGKEQFSETQIKKIKTMMGLIDSSLAEMNKILVSYKEQNDINRTYNLENEIDNYRDMIKSENFNDLNELKYSYTIGTMYCDLFDEFETVGDYVLNVVEARMGVKKKD
ncbi:MAG: Na/Pi cotransporter family protein [Muribaculaceae bacterium]|nr:Na/Pi cotransporter family protein [Muribaculaceae bacterium]